MPTVIVRAVCKQLNLEGAPYQHRSLAGIQRRVSGPAGEGWTWRIEGSQEAVQALGAYQIAGGDWVLDVDGKGRLVEVVVT